MRISKGMRNRRRKGRYPICYPSGAGKTTWKEWRDKRGLLHRADGPAVIGPDDHESYYIRGVFYASAFEYHVALAAMRERHK